MLRHLRLRTLVLLGTVSVVLALAAMPGIVAAGGVDDDAQAALQKLYATQPVAKRIGEKAKAVLVFPKMVKAGFMIGGQYGEGALIQAGQIVGHYNSRRAA